MISFPMIFFFIAMAPTGIYTLSLHDALPISALQIEPLANRHALEAGGWQGEKVRPGDRKSTRLNSSHPSISYAVFCLKKKTTHEPTSCNLLNAAQRCFSSPASRQTST